MLIRSQDGKCIVNLRNVTGIGIYGFDRDENGALHESYEKNYYMIDCESAPGGMNYVAGYATEEKAIKVLDMLQEAYVDHADVFIMPKEDFV